MRIFRRVVKGIYTTRISHPHQKKEKKEKKKRKLIQGYEGQRTSRHVDVFLEECTVHNQNLRDSSNLEYKFGIPSLMEHAEARYKLIHRKKRTIKNWNCVNFGLKKISQ
jgi:hypothetical protein